MKHLFWLAALACVAVAMSTGAATATAGTEAVVTSGSPNYMPGPFPENKQNEPGVAIDKVHPAIVAAGANEEIDDELCHTAQNSSDFTCPFTPGVGVSGVYFSLNGGQTWTQPTYTGLTARGCTSTNNNSNPCPYVGPIGTVPKYFENKVASDGDPSLAFGPTKGPATGEACLPQYTDGSRLYYANLTSKLEDVRSQETFRGYEAIYVSRTDCPRQAALGGELGKQAWADPVLVSPRASATTFKDKENVIVDDAASSPYYGNAYLCWVDFRSNGVFNGVSGDPEPVEVIRSTDGGETWDQQQQISPADNTATGANPEGIGGRQGCTIRTDSNGIVYAFWEGYDIPNKQEVIFMSRSFDGGKSWEKQTPILRAHDVGAYDPNQGDFTFDGVAGARTDSFPIVDIANGAPSGANAPDTIVMSWSDGSNGTPSPYTCCRGTVAGEQALVAYSNAKGEPGSWTTVVASPPGDRPDFPAVAISPNGLDLYLTYENFDQPWQPSPLAPPRNQEGKNLVAHFGTSGLSDFVPVDVGVPGDARGSSANGLGDEFLGDYNYADATDQYGVTVWNDTRLATDCPTVDAYRQARFAFATGSSNSRPTRPNPDVTCAPTFGNSDIFSWTSFPGP
jgi:hypothetical protein